MEQKGREVMELKLWEGRDGKGMEGKRTKGGKWREMNGMKQNGREGMELKIREGKEGKPVAEGDRVAVAVPVGVRVAVADDVALRDRVPVRTGHRLGGWGGECAHATLHVHTGTPARPRARTHTQRHTCTPPLSLPLTTVHQSTHQRYMSNPRRGRGRGWVGGR